MRIIGSLGRALLMSILLFCGCNDADFSGNQSAGNKLHGSGCIEGDRIIPNFPEEIAGCVDQGKLFNFDRSKRGCTAMRSAQFDCSFDSIEKNLTKLQLESRLLSDARGRGAKLIGCGESADGYTIVAQWYIPPAEYSCSTAIDEGQITTGCYRLYRAGEQRKNFPNTKEGTEAFVDHCMNENAI